MIYKFIIYINILLYLGLDFIVRRWFCDVVILVDMLVESYRGYFIFFCFEKSVVES